MWPTVNYFMHPLLYAMPISCCPDWLENLCCTNATVSDRYILKYHICMSPVTYITAHSRLMFSTAKCISDCKFPARMLEFHPWKLQTSNLSSLYPAITIHPYSLQITRCCIITICPLPFNTKHLSCDNCLEDKTEDYQNCILCMTVVPVDNGQFL